MILRIVRMSFSPDKIQDFIKFSMKAKPQLKEGRLFKREIICGLRIFQCVLHKSKWISPEALEKYRQSDLFKSTWARTKVLFNESASAFFGVGLTATADLII